MIKNKDWSDVIKKIQKKGFTQNDIMERTGATQSYISRMKAGHYNSPNWALGQNLLEMLK